jgi:hypothetical protein
MSACRVPMVPRSMTSASCAVATSATAMDAFWTSSPPESVLDGGLADLRGVVVQVST